MGLTTDKPDLELNRKVRNMSENSNNIDYIQKLETRLNNLLRLNDPAWVAATGFATLDLLEQHGLSLVDLNGDVITTDTLDFKRGKSRVLAAGYDPENIHLLFGTMDNDPERLTVACNIKGIMTNIEEYWIYDDKVQIYPEGETHENRAKILQIELKFQRKLQEQLQEHAAAADALDVNIADAMDNCFERSGVVPTPISFNGDAPIDLDDTATFMDKVSCAFGGFGNMIRTIKQAGTIKRLINDGLLGGAIEQLPLIEDQLNAKYTFAGDRLLGTRDSMRFMYDMLELDRVGKVKLTKKRSKHQITGFRITPKKDGEVRIELRLDNGRYRNFFTLWNQDGVLRGWKYIHPKVKNYDNVRLESLTLPVYFYTHLFLACMLRSQQLDRVYKNKYANAFLGFLPGQKFVPAS